jgi:hypothetical protein
MSMKDANLYYEQSVKYVESNYLHKAVRAINQQNLIIIET